jgi:hypothetical protein
VQFPRNHNQMNIDNIAYLKTNCLGIRLRHLRSGNDLLARTLARDAKLKLDTAHWHGILRCTRNSFERGQANLRDHLAKRRLIVERLQELIDTQRGVAGLAMGQRNLQ